MSSTRAETGGYERTDVRPSAVFALSALIVVLMGLGLFITSRVLSGFGKAAQAVEAEPHPMAEYRPGPSGPVLQTRAASDLEEYRRAQAQVATTYGWIDRQAGTVRVPLDRARLLMLERGFPVSEGDGR